MPWLVKYYCLHVERSSPGLAIKVGVLELPAKTPRLHRGPKPLLTLSIPISAVQFEKHGCIRNSHVGFDYQHSKQLASAIELRDDLFVWKDAHFGFREKAAEPFPVGTDARGVFLTNEGQFLVGINVRFDVLASDENGGRAFLHRGLFLIGNNGFDCWPGLCRVRRVGDDEPVAMTVELQAIRKNLFPVWLHFEINSSSEQTATLPHLPEAMRA